jgi:hypothetical protein
MRREERQNVSRPARIDFGNGNVVTCRIADVSAGGALLLIENNEWMPKRFVLIDAFTKTRREVRVAWASSNRVGVRFVDGGRSKPLGFGRRV